ncbi:MAG: hypothetical protein WDN45_02765 [Caulobacteraceae bacterium]
MRASALPALAFVLIAGPVLAQPAAPLPPGYSAFGAPPPTGPSPGLGVREFAPGAGKTYKVSFKAGGRRHGRHGPLRRRPSHAAGPAGRRRRHDQGDARLVRPQGARLQADRP